MIRPSPFLDDTEAFLRGYLECAIWSSTDPETEDPLDANYSIDDIHDEWVEIAEEDCNVFIRMYGFTLKTLGRLTGRDEAALGHDFWLTRNGHGAGYWDRYLECEVPDNGEAKRCGDRLTEGCKFFGEIDLMPIGNGEIGS